MEDRASFVAGAQWLAQKTRGGRELREKIHRSHALYIGEGKSFSESYELCVERFGDEHRVLRGYPLSERAFSGIVGRPLGREADSLTQALVVTKIQAMVDSTESACEEIDRQLDSLEGVVGWIEVEREDTTGGKFEGCKVKKVPVEAHKLSLWKKRFDAQQQFFESVKALIPKDKSVNIFVKDGDVSVLADEDLDRQLDRFRDKRVVNGG